MLHRCQMMVDQKNVVINNLYQKDGRDDEMREEVAALLHEKWMHWMKIAANVPQVNREFLFKPYSELTGVDKHASRRDADDILDIIFGRWKASMVDEQ